MILGMTTSTFTLLHVLISLVGIGSGLVVMYGFLTARRLDRWTALLLAATALTSLTGFLFPNEHLTPAIVVGILSMILLVVAIASRYALRMKGVWRLVYVISAAIALYFNVFVFVVQSFEKVPALRALAPTQNRAAIRDYAVNRARPLHRSYGVRGKAIPARFTCRKLRRDL
jgi:hypothetical protein